MIGFAFRRFGLALAVTVMTDSELERRIAAADELLQDERQVQEFLAREAREDAQGGTYMPDA